MIFTTTSLFIKLMTTLAACEHYNWNKDFANEEIMKTYSKVQDILKKEFTLDALKSLIEEERRVLGFKTFDKETPYTLIPLYLYSILPKGLPIENIFGEKYKTGDDINLDIRDGVIAYRLLLWDIPQNKGE